MIKYEEKGTAARRLRGVPSALGCVIVAAAVWLSGLLTPLDRGLQTTLFAMRDSSASGELVIVEMDAASLASIRQWPWDRRYYAAAVGKLDLAGVRSIAFDVDLSAPSNAESDAALSKALGSAKSQVILPTFAQRAAHGSDRVLDALPIAPFREATTLASVSVAPDTDGQVRRLPLGTITAGMARPSLSAVVAGRNGRADRSFPLDLAVQPGTIPRLSFIDVARGHFDETALAGKDVIIGATAIEMGDRYAVPGHGVLPGVVIQAIAAETLRKGVPVEGGGSALLLLVTCLGLWVARSPGQTDTLIRAAFSAAGLVLVWQVSWARFQILFSLAPAFVALAAIALLRASIIYRLEQQFRQSHDPETGLPNRRAMSRAPLTGEYTIAAAISNFERLHAVIGDAGCAEVVQTLAERIALTSHGAQVYRLDDRVLAWSLSAECPHPEQLLARLASSLRQPVEVAGRHVDAQIAFGIATAGALTEATLAASEAIRYAEPWRYHEAAERAVLEQQVSLMGELDAAIALNQLEVAYQPKLNLASGRIDSVEALVRWNHPHRGYLRPDTFIPLAEEADRIDELTLFVLKRTIEDLTEWCTHGLVLHAAVNLSARLLSSPRFLAATESVLAATGVPRHRLIFEVTESAALHDTDRAIEALEHFCAMGIEISMDDYGTGQSTLSYLKRLPLAELKIDRVFVQHAHSDRGDALLVRSTVNLAHELGLRVVAEGVEDPECLNFLREAGCDYAQGYLIGKPVPASELAGMASNERRAQHLYTDYTDLDDTPVSLVRTGQGTLAQYVPAAGAFAYTYNPTYIQEYIEDKQYYSNEITISNETKGRFNWIVGAYQYHENFFQPVTWFVGGDATDDMSRALLAPLNIIGGGLAAPNPRRIFYAGTGDLRTTSFAGFGQADFEVIPGLTVTAGLRYSSDRKKGAETYRLVNWEPTRPDPACFNLGCGAFTPAFDITTFVTGAGNGSGAVGRTLEGTWDGLTGRLALDYKVNDDLMFYGSYGRGLKAGGFTLGIYAAQPVVKKEDVDAFEIGMKSQPVRGATFNLTAFRYDYKNAQVPIDVRQPLSGLVRPQFFNIPRARSTGFEVETGWSPVGSGSV